MGRVRPQALAGPQCASVDKSSALCATPARALAHGRGARAARLDLSKEHLRTTEELERIGQLRLPGI